MKNLFMVLFLSTSLFAQDFTFDKEKGRAVPSFIGQIKIFKGKVFRVSEGKKNIISTGERFKVSDSVITEKGSFAKILLIDDTYLSIAPDSEVEFSKFDFTDKENRQTLTTIVRGQIASKVQTKAKKDGDIVYRTKYATMGVRGTRLLINHQLLGDKDISQFALTEGRAQVTDEKAGTKTDLETGLHMVIGHDAVKDLHANETNKIPEKELADLAADKLDESKDFKPFLPYFELSQLNPSSPFYPFVQKIIEVKNAGSADEEMRLKSKDKTWQHNLEKLNEKLKDNQKKNQ